MFERERTLEARVFETGVESLLGDRRCTEEATVIIEFEARDDHEKEGCLK